MNKIRRVTLLILLLIINSSLIYAQVSPDIIHYRAAKGYFQKWSSKDLLGQNEKPGYIRDFLLPEPKVIPSHDPVEEANSESRAGAIVYHFPYYNMYDYTVSDEYYVSTSDAMSYGLMFSVIYNDINQFNNLLRVLEYYKCFGYPSGESGLTRPSMEGIPGVKGLSVQDPVHPEHSSYQEFADYAMQTELKPEFKRWIGLEEGDNFEHLWGVLHTPDIWPDSGQIAGKYWSDELQYREFSGFNMHAELQIAFSLLMAHHKWVLNGNKSYKYLEMALEKYRVILNAIQMYGDFTTSNQNRLITIPMGSYSIFSAAEEDLHVTMPSDWLLSSFRACFEVSGDFYIQKIIKSIQDLMSDFSSTNDEVGNTGLIPDYAMISSLDQSDYIIPFEKDEELQGLYPNSEPIPHTFYNHAFKYIGQMCLDYILYGDDYSFRKIEELTCNLISKYDFTSIDSICISGLDIDTGNSVEPDSAYLEETASPNYALLANLLLADGLSLEKRGYTNLPRYVFDQLIRNSSDSSGLQHFESQYSDIESKIGWVDVHGEKHFIDSFPGLNRSFYHTGFVNDTWKLFTLTALSGSFFRPEINSNVLKYHDIRDLKILEGAEFVSLRYHDEHRMLVLLVEDVPDSDDPFAITLGIENCQMEAGSQYSFDILMKSTERDDVNELAFGQKIFEIDDSYINISECRRLVIDCDDKMPYQGILNSYEVGNENSYPAVLEIGLNSGLKEGTAFFIKLPEVHKIYSEINNIRTITSWRQNTKYIKGDVIQYRMESYICTNTHLSNYENLPGDSYYWKLCNYLSNYPRWFPEAYYPAGKLVYSGGKVYKAIVGHQSIYSPATTPNLWELVHNPFSDIAIPWFEGAYFGKDDYVEHYGRIYRCLQSHTAVDVWNPAKSAALWVLEPDFYIPREILVWNENVEYELGEIVEYEGVDYICRIKHTSRTGWEPYQNYTLWSVVGE